MQRLVSADPRLWLSRSWTTRPRRAGEPEDAYTFVSREQFEAHEAAGGFIETNPTLGHLYGTPVADPPPGRDVLLEIDVEGAAQVRARHPEAVVILVVAPSPEVQAERMRRRGDPDDQVAARLELGAKELAAGRELADAEVVNDDLDRAVDEVRGIIDARRAGR